MRPSFDVSGNQITNITEYDITTSTNIAIDQVVVLTNGKVALAAQGQTTAILGTAVENHPGTADTLNIRANGPKIKVYDSPTQIFECAAPQVTATGGTTTTMLASACATFVDNDFVGGFMKLLSKGASSTNTDPLGTLYPITGSTASTKTFTTTQTAGGAITAGDVFAIYPPRGFQKGQLDTNISKLDLTATNSLALKVMNFNTDRGVLFMQAGLHQNSNKQS